ncbi:hypothetical protein HD806DRAFT_525248 [Xylariaceae sp. AK1471]|nr:hypothetical protein HD806DRAFT_525248 [Xylariaceae sp. AK1471]
MSYGPFPVNRKTLERYNCIFGPPPFSILVPETTIPGQRGLTPWLIEAPLNSVELLEAVLKPSQPFKIYKAHHVFLPRPIMDMPLKPVKKDDWLDFWHEAAYKSEIRWMKLQKALHKEFYKGQGRLTCDREVSFVYLDKGAMETMLNDFMFTYHAVRLNWIAIPWNSGEDQPTSLAHPWPLVLRQQPTPEFSYRFYFHRMLEERGLASLAESGFPRSLLEQGTVPLPETLRDWLMGIPGETAALPYFAPTAEENTQAESRQHQLVLRPSL